MNVHPWNRDLWQTLAASRERLPHALLFQGAQGVGKRQFALELGRWLLCGRPGTDGACGECAACNWFEQGSHPDFRLIEPQGESTEGEAEGKKGGKQITIEAIRQLGEFLALAAHQGGWRVVVVHPAETLNPAAANALLKTLEEPPARVLLILIAHQPRRLLPTVLSRCRRVLFKPPEPAAALAWLADQPLAGADADALLREAGGAPLLALDNAEPERLERQRHFLDALETASPGGLQALAQDFQARLPEAWGWLYRWVHDLTRVAAGVPPRYFPERRGGLERLAGQVSPAGLWTLQGEITQTARWLRHPLNGQLLLESLFLRYSEIMEARHGR